MILALMRHGAYDDSPLAATDGKRGLTYVGRMQSLRSAMKLQDIGTSPETIVASPLLRARQTAEIVAEQLGYVETIERAEELLPGASAAEMRTLLLRYAGMRALLFVGHMPSMAEFARSLLATERDTIAALGKSEIVGIELHELTERPAGTLLWRIVPNAP